MKRIWNLLSFMAVVNLLALGMLVAWLWQTDRLDRARLHEVRELFAPTLTEVADAAAAGAEATDDPSAPAVASAAHTRQMSRVTEREFLAMQRLKDQQRMLREQLDEAAAAVQAQGASVQADQAAWEQRQAADLAATGDAQFAKAVRHLESLPAKQGKMILMELIGRGEHDRAVQYLDSMGERPAAKLLKEFKTPAEARVATELLESLGRLGRATGPGKEPDDAQRSAEPSATARGDEDDPGSAAADAGAAPPGAGAF